MPNFRVSWLVKCTFPFTDLNRLPWHLIKRSVPIGNCFNGQELNPKIGNYLSYLLLKEGICGGPPNSVLKSIDLHPDKPAGEEAAVTE